MKKPSDDNNRCPKCRSVRLIKFGRVWSGGRKHQRFLCNNCGHTTIKPRGNC